MTQAAQGTWERALVQRAILDAIRKVDPRHVVKNPVMFVVEVGAVFTTIVAIHAAVTGAGDAPPAFTGAVAALLWITVVFANFAEALAEGRGRAQADALRQTRADVDARKLAEPRHGAASESVRSSSLRAGDVVLVEAGELIPADGDVIEGMASVDESAITGESAPVIRESGGDRSAVTGGTRVLSDWLVVRVSADPGAGFLDRMIAMVEGASRQKTPNEIALEMLLAGLSIVFLVATVTLWPFSRYAASASGAGATVPLSILAALLVCLVPTTIGALLSAIGIAGMDRLVRANVIAKSGRAVEAAGDVDVIFLDKTGTITHGNRRAVAFLTATGVSAAELTRTAWLASAADETAEGRSIVELARAAGGGEPETAGFTFLPFTARTRTSGVDGPGRSVRKGAGDAIARFVEAQGGEVPAEVAGLVDDVARRGATPLVVAEGARVFGVIELADVVKPGIAARFAELRRMGIKTVMITGDNPLTAATIAAEAGVDDFLAEATPEAKLAMIRDYQARGHLVAMTGDGTNDAPALAQADVAVAMNTGTQAAKEAGNMIDLDSDPTKLLSIVEIGKQLLVTRGALTTLSVANDVAKYFVILPAAFAVTYPALGALDVMRLTSPATAVLSALVFNAAIIVALIPIALRGVRSRPAPAADLLGRNLGIYGLGGLLLPFPCIKLVDLGLSALGVR